MKSAMTILVVDDEAMMRELLDKILRRDGYQVLSAADGAEALEIMHQQKVNLVISDIKMPRVDGFGLLKAVKSEFPKVPIIMMTAFGDTFSVKDALLLGADEYVTKPFKSYEIALVVERAYWRLLAAEGMPESRG
jgi:two-component system, NtrC family, response regulator PilR